MWLRVRSQLSASATPDTDHPVYLPSRHEKSGLAAGDEGRQAPYFSPAVGRSRRPPQTTSRPTSEPGNPGVRPPLRHSGDRRS